MYSVIVNIAGFGMLMYFFLPIILGGLIFSNNKALFFNKPLKQRKMFISILGLIFGLVAICSIVVSFENGLAATPRMFVIFSSITYVSYTIYALIAFLKLSKSRQVKRSV